jgi:hypothetical protein
LLQAHAGFALQITFSTTRESAYLAIPHVKHVAIHTTLKNALVADLYMSLANQQVNAYWLVLAGNTNNRLAW